MIRKAEEKDIKGIIELLKQVVEVHHVIRPDIFKGGVTKYKEDELKAILSEPKTPVFICEEDGKILGHAFCQIKEVKNNVLLCNKKTFYIDDICVDENARRKGVGKALYEFILGYAKSIGCDFITLNVWKGNDSAENFYRAMGMKERHVIMEHKI